MSILTSADIVPLLPLSRFFEPLDFGWELVFCQDDFTPILKWCRLKVRQEKSFCVKFLGTDNVVQFAGGAFAFLHRFISPDSFRLDSSFLMVAIVVLGGLGNIFGAMLGAALLLVLPEALRGFSDYRMIFFGLILYAVLRFRPQGIAGVR